jgi:hypothetical protein
VVLMMLVVRRGWRHQLSAHTQRHATETGTRWPLAAGVVMVVMVMRMVMLMVVPVMVLVQMVVRHRMVVPRGMVLAAI